MSRDVLTESAPERIWLQVNADAFLDDRSEPIPRENWSDMTWCAEEIGGQEVAYVRADIANGLLEALRELMDCSEYSGWSDADLAHSIAEGDRYLPMVVSARAAIAKATQP